MKSRNLFGMLLFFFCSTFFMACDKDDEPFGESHSLVANTTWMAKITPPEISVPEEYRENGYWILTFTNDRFAIGICDKNKVVAQYWFKGTYRFTERNVIRVTNDGDKRELKYILMPETNEIRGESGYGLMNYVMQPNH